jgi:hypothetical protein
MRSTCWGARRGACRARPQSAEREQQRDEHPDAAKRFARRLTHRSDAREEAGAAALLELAARALHVLGGAPVHELHQLESARKHHVRGFGSPLSRLLLAQAERLARELAERLSLVDRARREFEPVARTPPEFLPPDLAPDLATHANLRKHDLAPPASLI